jgi:uncharacterized protein (DUF885 family)
MSLLLATATLAQPLTAANRQPIATRTQFNLGQAANQAASGTQLQTATDQSVPADLRPLLAPAQSEMRLVTQRYNADRATLNGNYTGGGRGVRDGGGRGGGREGGAPGSNVSSAASNISLSIPRIARLKRFDLDWQATLTKVDAGKLSAAAKTDLESLKNTIQNNLQQLEADSIAIAQLTPLLPFASAILDLTEQSKRLQAIDAQKAAAIMTQVYKQISEVRAKVESGISGATTNGNAIRTSKELALRAADSIETLRSFISGWAAFYNSYDPLYTWWMGLPNKKVDEALVAYAALLRDKVAPASQDVKAAEVSASAATIAPSPSPKVSYVPNLQEILALPQDEMTAIVQRFGGRGRGGRGGGGNAGPARTKEFYTAWLTALKTLDFDKLSRNAQVGYLFIRDNCEKQLTLMDAKPQQNIPRKTDNSGIAGAARGRDGLILDLGQEMIPYTPEQLIALAEREFAWCENEMRKASRQMGFGDDWKKAIEKVKGLHVAPGKQPEMIGGLLHEAIDYLRAHDLITVPEVARESLRMQMMSPQQQLVNPFFLGGSSIIVSFPTDTMEYDARLQSMRGNNIHFSRATAHHEMIPGHNLVGYLGQRFAGYRAGIGGSTPFFGEGWPVYWETILYDMNFFKSPEDKVGALFWRMHRCARIVFSLKFHMGQWSPQECVDFLVNRVGHEPDNARAEVVRSFAGNYGPLYQAAYLLGALQLRGLRKELVDSGQMSNKQFHDEIMRQGSMPIALLRLALTKQKLTRDMSIDWKFYGELPDR